MRRTWFTYHQQVSVGNVAEKLKACLHVGFARIAVDSIARTMQVNDRMKYVGLILAAFFASCLDSNGWAYYLALVGTLAGIVLFYLGMKGEDEKDVR